MNGYYPHYLTPAEIELFNFLISISLLGALGLGVIAFVSMCAQAADDLFSSKANYDDHIEASYERQARELRAKQALIDAETDYMDSAIKRARTGGEFSELNQIAEHERTLRELRRRLQGGAHA